MRGSILKAQLKAIEVVPQRFLKYWMLKGRIAPKN